MFSSKRYKAWDKLGKVGVLMGGPSSEKEISLKSGKAVVRALHESGVNAVEIIVKSENIKENISLLKSKHIDCAFIALHGRFGEDGNIQRILSRQKIPYTGSGVRASKLAMDKVASRNIFKRYGLFVPSFKVINHYSKRTSLPEWIKFPLVIKPALTGSSIGISIVDDYKDIKPAIESAFKFDKRVIIEEYIKGRELTVGILEGRPLPVVEIIPKRHFFDYQAKYKHGLTKYTVPAKLSLKVTKKVQKVALLAHRFLGCFGCSRVDIILDKRERPFILEVNTIPGLTSTSLLPKACRKAGIDFNDLCIKLIELAYGKAKN
ncbi:MAG: D-alanine--D-alanine ligase [Candidatus Omnitrophica bacterium]|nr:D-alanine--D-alanine ligase [Candidatus Omnitrophota bacterium]